jgi:hypothetical protein
MLELLEKNPQATEVVKSYYLDVMLQSLNDESLPENFKDFVRQQGIDNDKIAKIIDGSPRNLFDVFDENELIIETMYMERTFHYTISDGEEVIAANSEKYNTRKECDKAAVKHVFKLLNDKLCPTLTES